MRTAVLTEPGHFAFEDRPRPSPGPDEVTITVRTAASGRLNWMLARRRR